MAIRVVQWTTGNVGRQSVQAVAARPDLELVGCYAWSDDKVGRDVGELCGIDPTGVTATNDIDALLGLAPDCVVYNPMWFDVDEMVRILEAGVNMVTTAAFINGRSYRDDGRQRLVDACHRGGSSLFGSGISPGFIELVTIALAGASDRIDRIVISESADTTAYDSPATEIPVGFGRPLDDPELPAMSASATMVFSEAVAEVGDALGIELDEIVCEAEYAKTTKDLDLGSWRIAKDTVAGVTIRWHGKVAGRSVVEVGARWRKGDSIEPDWEIAMGWEIAIHGRPTLTAKIDILPPPYFEATTMEEFMVLGHILTAMPVVNAIPRVVAAPPGIVTYNDLPLPLPRHLVEP
jgi:2,4-diaminopentanoate dehydrogenase